MSVGHFLHEELDEGAGGGEGAKRVGVSNMKKEGSRRQAGWWVSSKGLI